jgi:hypothetical protein
LRPHYLECRKTALTHPSFRPDRLIIADAGLRMPLLPAPSSHQGDAEAGRFVTFAYSRRETTAAVRRVATSRLPNPSAARPASRTTLLSVALRRCRIAPILAASGTTLFIPHEGAAQHRGRREWQRRPPLCDSPCRTREPSHWPCNRRRQRRSKRLPVRMGQTTGRGRSSTRDPTQLPRHVGPAREADARRRCTIGLPAPLATPRRSRDRY